MYGDTTKTRIISDLSIASPAVALSKKHLPGHWQVVDYEIDGLTGRLLSAGPETDPPAVEIPLETSGWHAVYIGFWAPRWTQPHVVRIKLTSDERYVHWHPEAPNNTVLIERFWNYKDIQPGDCVQVALQVRGNQPNSAGIAFIKLVPLTDDEIEAVEADRADASTHRLIVMDDSFSEFGMRNPVTAEEIEEWLEPLRYSDAEKMFWCLGAGGDVVAYNSRIGKLIGHNTADYPRVGDRLIADSLSKLFEQGIDPLKVARDYVKSLGIEFHVSQRMEAFACSPPFEEFFTGWIYPEHPEWHCVDRDGVSVVRLSYAFPGFRQLVIDIFKELAAYEIDGVHMIFNRGAPFLLYEQPLIDGFLAEFGEDPRELDENDERWLSYRARTMTQFLRDLRAEMGDLQISAHVLNDEATNLFFGLDLKAWVEEGLVDNLIAYPWRNPTSDNIDIDYFAQLCQGSDVKWYIEMMPRQIEPDEYIALAQKIYDAGASGLSLWDTDQRYLYWKRWHICRQLGHDPATLDANDHGAQEHSLISIGGYRVDRYPPHWTY